MDKKANNLDPNIFVILVFLVIFVIGGCSATREQETEESRLNSIAAFPGYGTF